MAIAAGRRQRATIPYLAVALILAVAGCTAAGSPSASPSPPSTAVPSPTSSPDIVAGFVAKVVDVQANGTSTVTGSITAAGIAGRIEGEFDFDGGDSRSLMAVTFGDSETVTERIERLGEAWTRTRPGPWLVDEDPPARSETLAATLAAIRSVDDGGVVHRDGSALHRLRPTVGSAIPPEAFGFDDRQIRAPELAIEFLVEPDGTPVVLAVTASWTQPLDAADALFEVALDLVFDDWGGGVTIEPPANVWVVYTSDALGYSMAHPADWSVTHADGQDAFGVDGGAFLHVAPQELSAALTIDQFRDAVIEVSGPDLGGSPETVEPATLGGQPAYRMIYYTDDAAGTPIAVVDYLTVRGGVGWEVYMVTLAGQNEAADLAFLETFVASFAFAD